MSQHYNITSQSFDGPEIPSELNSQHWDAGIGGQQTVDKRSIASVNFTKNHTKKYFHLAYNLNSNQIDIDGTLGLLGLLKTRVSGSNSILVDATTLNCPELIFILRAAKALNVEKVSFLYLEPIEYDRKIENNLLLHRDFDLSVNRRFQGMHGCNANLNDTIPGKAVFFLGYEKSRLGQALVQEDLLKSWEKHAVFGIPAFQPGWEMNAIANNVQHFISENHFHIQYAGAASVGAAYRLLKRLRKEDKEERPILVAPLGTKPHALAASMFVVEHSDFDSAILLYDHPQRTNERTRDINKWHLYDIY